MESFETKNSQNGKASEISKKSQQVQDSDENKQKTETNGTIQQLSEEGYMKTGRWNALI